MPWREVSVSHARLQFVLHALRHSVDFTTLCAQYGISRKTGYKWLARFDDAGSAALADRSHMPHMCPHRLPEWVRTHLLALRDRHPTWGPRKLVAYAVAHPPPDRHVTWPARSTVAEWLRATGRVTPRRRQARRSHPSGGLLTHATAPNDVWTVDFKGEFRTGNGQWCYPLTVVDSQSRYLLALQHCPTPRTALVASVFARLFRTHGLPRVIRSDNGAPFAIPNQLDALSRLAVWWLRLGIAPERIALAAPQQNGRHERLHRTLKAEAIGLRGRSRPAATARGQQARFDAFRLEYNHERPHEALGLRPPALVYHRSARPAPHQLTLAQMGPLAYPAHFETRLCGQAGWFGWQGRPIYVGRALANQRLGLELVSGGWLVHFHTQILGYLDQRTMKLTPPSRWKVSPILLD